MKKSLFVIQYFMLISCINHDGHLVKIDSHVKKSTKDLRDHHLRGKVKYVSELHFRYEQSNNSYIKELTGKQELFYDSSGKQSEIIIYSDNGSLDQKRVFKYDSFNKNIEIDFYNSLGVIYNKVYNKFDADNNCIESDFYGNSNSLIRVIKFKYDSGNNMIEDELFNFDNKLESKNIYKYDERGNVISIINYFGKMVASETFYTYNSKDDVINRKYVPCSTHSAYIEKYSYSNFDPTGNWQEYIICDEEGIKLDLITREIKYY